MSVSETNTPASTSTFTIVTENEKVLVTLANKIKNYDADELKNFLRKQDLKIKDTNFDIFYE